jgi:hypothetical protein
MIENHRDMVKLTHREALRLKLEQASSIGQGQSSKAARPGDVGR